MPESSLTLYHHPFTRAATAIWMLEEVGRPYTLNYVDVQAGEQRQQAFRAINPMGKLPALVDGDTVITETAAIGLYLADRYAPGVLAPALDSPARGPYFRWSVFSPAVIEPGCMAKGAGWQVNEGQAGWGNYETMLETLEAAIGEGPWLLGENFSMADVIVGATVRFLLRFEMLEPRDAFTRYAERLGARPACQAAERKNMTIATERGLA